uniref:CN hydrolase domain-containing protein n=2 Tax=Dendroctonus ponderosae TaxID=77166 RepID=A0AAR5PYP4_DENPD
MFCVIGVIVCCLMHGSSADYIGAVVEYNHVPSENSSLTVEENLEHYLYQISQASVFGAQIIVFPEYGLTGLVQQPDDYAVWIPDVGTEGFLSEAYVLLTLSNAAIERRLYVVANLLEKANGTNNNTLYYNTNVVFADNGTLVAKYRKINLNEGESSLTPGNATSIFVTSFGTFALVTGTDIWFSHPSQSVLVNNGVTDVIFPTAWNSTFPFQMSLSVQVGYALANRVNLLAANINNP